jgi:hypothetical protein
LYIGSGLAARRFIEEAAALNRPLFRKTALKPDETLSGSPQSKGR